MRCLESCMILTCGGIIYFTSNCDEVKYNKSYSINIHATRRFPLTYNFRITSINMQNSVKPHDMNVQNAESMTNKSAYKFIILVGFISLLADMTYEGARSITGPYLAILGASAATVGFVAGFGELLGYGLRLISGYLSDKTGRYWTLTFIGYIVNLLSVPLLAVVSVWQFAAVLMIAERSGKAIRTPARDAMLSHACHRIGAGWGFGLHEAMDQFGAMLGPLLVALVLYLHGGYRHAFAILLLPAIVALIVLVTARVLFPNPQNLEPKTIALETHNMKSTFWIYLMGSACIAAGYADFPLIAYHFEKSDILSAQWIPVSYAVAMGASAISAIIFGHLYDRIGYVVLIAIAILTSFFAPFSFLGSHGWVFLGVILWGIGMGSQSSLMKAIITHLAPKDKRGSAYGIFNTGYGIAWFLGSVTMGIIYDHSIFALVVFSIFIQLCAIPFFVVVWRRLK